MAPRSVARWAPRSGDRAAEGMPGRAKIYIWRQQPATGSHLSLEDTASPYAVCPILTQPGWDGALRAVCRVRLLVKGIGHSRRRLSRTPSRKAAVAPAEICSALP